MTQGEEAAEDIEDADAAGAVDPPLVIPGFELYDAGTALDTAFARVMVLGPAKAGKTTCVVKGAPSALIINCDGANATKGAAGQGAKFHALDVTSKATWHSACRGAAQLAEQGKVRTIVVDTASLLADMLLDELSVTLTGWDVWTELASNVIKGIKVLREAPAHLFVNAHMTPDADAAAGILPAIGGKLKVRLPALLDDWVLLDVEPGRKIAGRDAERAWLLGPQKSWTHSGRNIRRTTIVPATFDDLLAALQIKP